jgi:N-acetylglucosamine-6-phosphate deacetylase
VDEIRVTGRVVTPAGVVDDGVVVVSGGRIAYVGPAVSPGQGSGGDVVEDGGDRFVLPGLVDVHDHGGGGASFSTPAPEALATAAAHHRGRGTTSLVASVVTDDPERMLAAVANAADGVDAGIVAAVHVEGPFLAARRCGAQDPRFLLAPDPVLADELLAAGRGHVRVMTIAPELDGADLVVERLLQQGVVPAVGHTEAPPALVRRTLAATHAALGRPGLVTHLFNGMPALHHRRPGPVAGALGAAAAGEAMVELIADGVHLADESVLLLFDLLGPERVVLVTDAMAAAGMPDGSYVLGPQRVRVVEGVARLGETAEGPLAGGTADLLGVVRRCVAAGVSLVDAVMAATSTPARAVGLDARAGALAPGRPADLLVVEPDLRPVRVMRAGSWVVPGGGVEEEMGP